MNSDSTTSAASPQEARRQIDSDPVQMEQIDAALNKLGDRFRSLRNEHGHWTGQLSPSALSTATAISALSFYAQHPDADAEVRSQAERQVDCGLRWLAQQQNQDGGFGDTRLNSSNISTTMLVIAAIHAAGQQTVQQTLLERAENYVDAQGSIAGLRRRYGKDKTFAVPILANCAMAGLVPWKEVSALPFEAACVPQKFYHLLQLPVVSYAIPALVAIGQAKFLLDPPWDPVRRTIRSWATSRSLKVLERMQPASGGYLEAVPLTSFVSMALIKTDRVQHPVVQNGIRFLLDSFCDVDTNSEPDSVYGIQATTEPRVAALGTWPIDTNLATWSTTLTINAFANHPQQFKNQVAADLPTWQRCLEWVLSCQNKTVHPFTGSPPGGWGWTDLTGSVPDADDTPGALLALKHLQATGQFDSMRASITRAALSGVDWLLKLQNRDRGWPTFCRGWGNLPFDRSGSDITAHVIRGLVAWKGELAQAATMDEFRHLTPSRVDRAIDNGFAYLLRNQRDDGSWLPLWFGNQDQPDDINPFYGTAKVICAYRDADRLNTQPARFGLNWLVQQQNPDGGWGGGPSIRWTDASLGQSSVEETALCCESLLGLAEHGIMEPQFQEAATRGIQWLLRADRADCLHRFSPIGFYFAKLWYYEESYPLIFATSSLAKARRTTHLNA